MKTQRIAARMLVDEVYPGRTEVALWVADRAAWVRFTVTQAGRDLAYACKSVELVPRTPRVGPPRGVRVELLAKVFRADVQGGLGWFAKLLRAALRWFRRQDVRVEWKRRPYFLRDPKSEMYPRGVPRHVDRVRYSG